MKTKILAPFLLLSLLVHIALLVIIHPLEKSLYATPQHPLDVYLSAHTVLELKEKIQRKSPTSKSNSSVNTRSEKIMANTPKSDMQIFDAVNLIETAKNIAKEEAQKTEQNIAELDKRKLNTPVGMLLLKKPQKEIRLANGMLKIITSAGAVCFHSVPMFAQESTELFGIPSSCP